MADVTYLRVVETSLEHSPDFIVNWIDIWGIISGEIKAAVFRDKNCTVSPAR